jgi:hypothetical protein
MSTTNDLPNIFLWPLAIIAWPLAIIANILFPTPSPPTFSIWLNVDSWITNGFTGSANVCQPVYKGCAAVAGIYTYSWDFGDGTTGSGSSVTHTYLAKGTYLVKVTAVGTTNSGQHVDTWGTMLLGVPPI